MGMCKGIELSLDEKGCFVDFVSEVSSISVASSEGVA